MVLIGPTIFENEFIRQGILLGNEFPAHLRFRVNPEAVLQVGEVLSEISEALGWKQKQLARAFQVSQGTISKWISGQQSPVKDQWDLVLGLIRRDPRLAHLRHEASTGEVSIMGRVGAGSIIEPEIEQIPEDGLYSVTLPFAVPSNMVGFVVHGDSMLPKYEAGDVIVVYKEPRHGISAFLGQLVAVLTEDGRRYVKKLYGGSTAGLYRLESFNASPIHDVSIAWVGEIYAVLPASQISEVPPKRTAPKKAVRARA